MTHPTKLCIALLLAASAASAALVNGDFETGDFTGWSVTDVYGVGNGTVEPVDVTGTGPSKAARFQAGRSGWPFGPAGGVLLSQSFYLALSDTYSISASIASWLPAQTAGMGNAHAGTFELLLDSTLLDKVVFGNIMEDWTFRDQLQYEGSVSAGTHELAIRIRRDFAAGADTPLQFVDDVAVVPAGQAALLSASMTVNNPEPGTLFLIGTGFAALLLGRRLS